MSNFRVGDKVRCSHISGSDNLKLQYEFLIGAVGIITEENNHKSCIVGFEFDEETLNENTYAEEGLIMHYSELTHFGYKDTKLARKMYPNHTIIDGLVVPKV
jgi:hypothetical protein